MNEKFTASTGADDDDQQSEQSLAIAVLEFPVGKQPEFFGWIEGTTRERFADGDTSEETPKLFLYDNTGRVHIVDLTNTPKDIWPQMIRMALSVKTMLSVGFVSEAWMAKTDKNEGDAAVDRLYDQYGSLEHVPGRMEVLMMHLYTAGRPQLSRFIEIKGEGASRTLGEAQDFGSDSIGGRLSDANVGNTGGATLQ